MEFPSKLLEDLVYNISQLSGIGKRSALRIALEILRKPKEYSRDLSESIYDFKTQIKFCSECYNISDKDVCDICLNPSRDQSLVCIVEDIRDVIYVEDFVLSNQNELPLIIICGNSEKMISIVNKTLKKIDVNFEETRYGRIRVNSLDA